MAGNTKDRIVTGLLCKRKVDGSPVVTHVIVREFQWESSEKARGLSVYWDKGLEE